jgi:hypothetical protein
MTTAPTRAKPPPWGHVRDHAHDYACDHASAQAKHVSAHSDRNAQIVAMSCSSPIMPASTLQAGSTMSGPATIAARNS